MWQAVKGWGRRGCTMGWEGGQEDSSREEECGHTTVSCGWLETWQKAQRDCASFSPSPAKVRRDGREKQDKHHHLCLRWERITHRARCSSSSHLPRGSSPLGRSPLCSQGPLPPCPLELEPVGPESLGRSSILNSTPVCNVCCPVGGERGGEETSQGQLDWRGPGAMGEPSLVAFPLWRTQTGYRHHLKYSHFADGHTEVQRVWVSYPKLGG